MCLPQAPVGSQEPAQLSSLDICEEGVGVGGFPSWEREVVAYPVSEWKQIPSGEGGLWSQGLLPAVPLRRGRTQALTGTSDKQNSRFPVPYLVELV